jgi:D-alanine-D-alanine ligase
MPPAEMTFRGYPPGKPRIVDYAAKWHAQSFEFNNTVRRFDFPPEDAPLLGRLAEAAQACSRVFGLTGYARVDCRVDAEGRPFVLEVNVNPCLSPDAGFAAATVRAGLDMTAVVARIVAARLAATARPPERRATGDAAPAALARAAW